MSSSAWSPSRTPERSPGPREGEDEGRAATMALTEIQVPTVRLHDPPREEQTDAEPLVRTVARPLDLREQLEEPITLIRGDPRTAIGHLEGDLIVVARGADLDGGVGAEVERVLQHQHERARCQRRVRQHLCGQEAVRDPGVDRPLFDVGELTERI